MVSIPSLNLAILGPCVEVEVDGRLALGPGRCPVSGVRRVECARTCTATATQQQRNCNCYYCAAMGVSFKRRRPNRQTPDQDQDDLVGAGQRPIAYRLSPIAIAYVCRARPRTARSHPWMLHKV